MNLKGDFMKEVNGKVYPMWQQFIDMKDKFIGGVLEDHDMGMYAKTKITDITLEPNGKTSAFFSVEGEDFGCGFDVEVGGIGSGDEGWVTFYGYGGHKWRIKTID